MSDCIIGDLATIVMLVDLHEPWASRLKELLLNLKDTSALLRIRANEVRCELITNVGRHNLGLSDIVVAILYVGQVWEVHAKVGLVLSPLLLRVALFFNFNAAPGEAVSVDVATVNGTDGPVSKDRFVLSNL